VKRLALIIPLLFGGVPSGTSLAQKASVADAAMGVLRIDRLLQDWRWFEAKELAERLLSAHPDLPAVQFAAGWVKFHFADHRAALELAERAAKAFGDRMESDHRLGLIRATARIAKEFVRSQSPDKRVIVFHRPGSDQILVPYIVETVGRTLDVVGEDLGHRLDHPVLVELVPDRAALADMTGLTLEEIETSGVIAVCKYGRLLITSPRATLSGFGWLDTASHELVHMIISEKTHNQVPIWIHEALAKYEDSRWRAGEPLYRPGLSPDKESRLAKALRRKTLITFEQMHPSMALLPSREATALAFCEVFTVTQFLLERKGYAGIRGMLDHMKNGDSDMQAISKVYGLNREGFERAWLAWLGRQKYRILLGDEMLDVPTGRRERAASSERTLLKQKDPGLRDFFHLGQLLRARGRTRASVVEYKKAVDRAGPLHAALWLLSDKLGIALMALGFEKQAKDAFTASLRINPNDQEAHLRLGSLLLVKQPYQAWLHFRECLRLNPQDPRVHRLSFMAAVALLKKGDERKDWEKHRRLHDRALKILSKSAAPGKAGEAGPLQETREEPAILKIHTRPWARLWLDYRDTGMTTPIYHLEVAPGAHVLGLTAPCAPEPKVLRVFVKAGETVVVDEELCPKKNDAGRVRQRQLVR
jgi:tetratricopeptide (TPR) repeat protein